MTYDYYDECDYGNFSGRKLRISPIEKEQSHEKTKTLNFKKTPNIK